MIRSIGVGNYIYSKENLVLPKNIFKVSQLGLDCSRKNLVQVQYYSSHEGFDKNRSTNFTEKTLQKHYGK